MVSVETQPAVQPLKILLGLNYRLELYSDRVIIARTDLLGRLTDLSDTVQVIPLNHIKNVAITEARGTESRWVCLIIVLHNGHKVLISHQRQYHMVAREIKNFLNDYVHSHAQVQ